MTTGEVERDSPPAVATWMGLVAVAAMATYPFLALVMGNLGQSVDVSAVTIWWGITMVLSVGIVAAAHLGGPTLGNWVAGVVAVLLWCLFSFQPITGVQPASMSGLAASQWWALVVGIVMVVALPIMQHPAAQRFLAVLGVVLILATLLQGGITARAPEPDAEPIRAPAKDGDEFIATPNVWFFALDGLASDAYVEQLGFYEPRPHETSMEAQGFVFQPGATSNYPLTYLSLSSTLMGDYGFTGVEEPFMGPFVRQLQGDNATVTRLRANGYSYAHAHPDLWSGNQCSGIEDLCVGNDGAISETDLALARITPLAALYAGTPDPSRVAQNNDPADLVQRILDAQLPSPTFNFVHVLNPHPPLLRDAECGVRNIDLALDGWGDGVEYSDAVQCLHRQLESAASQILAADPDALIIMQGDHGARLGIDWSQSGGVLLADADYFSIYSAIRMPTSCRYIDIPDDLTPVNTFRLVDACLQDRPPDLLPNRRFPIHASR